MGCLVLSGCFPRKPDISRSAVDHPPEKIIAALNSHSNHFPTFRSLIKASLTFPEEGKQKTQSFDAAFLYRAEDQRFRLQGMDILGRTHFDLACQPRDLTIYLPPSEVTYSGDPTDLTDMHGAGVFYILRKTMEGLPAGLTAETVSFSELADLPVIREDIETYSLIEVNPETLLMEKRTLVKQCRILGEIVYETYEQTGGLLLPTRISVTLPLQKVSFHFTFESFTPESTLPDRLFEVTQSPVSRLLPLSDMRMDFLF